MGQDDILKHRRLINWAYVFMFFALFTVITGVIAYLLSAKVAQAQDVEVWMQAQALWVMRSIMLFVATMIFAVLWFIPLHFYYWDTFLWVKGCTVVGVIFAFIAWMMLLNAFIKGLAKYIKNKAVF
ncbi:hypothetical protein [Acinetobacter nectaris]|uniref:Uncharacterized protein n=1 Tax=Acinetobacter nectaris CIP 110549 TaxID=1392540 RepID=V2UU56_9GAMM|nr:hypothetical protein [Acinetobacter nectaris]ESK38854.1 hypothetical protein P256_01673 [Acinetobacter nectaris CIP 110549]MCF8998377.1 hypothetical protein [Acinetobacter nectaris]MCF9027771.1 hypothetical protein [Acinetobacter nectaris]MCF9033709.1 hypothetical protein [Acinetobacter nectaris]MCF9047009.1 hypothetical protein [Acinetobacter nectaris]